MELEIPIRIKNSHKLKISKIWILSLLLLNKLSNSSIITILLNKYKYWGGSSDSIYNYTFFFNYTHFYRIS